MGISPKFFAQGGSRGLRVMRGHVRHPRPMGTERSRAVLPMEAVGPFLGFCNRLQFAVQHKSMADEAIYS
jgi:hypothetical protein